MATSKKPQTQQQKPIQEQKPATPNASRISQRQVSQDEIARRAYELWKERGAPHGDDQADWHRAEQELSKKQ